MAGIAAGLIGGVVLVLAPDSHSPATIPVALAIVAGCIGGIGAAGVGAGLAIAEALARSFRPAALVAFGALGGGAIGAIAHAAGSATLEGLFGHALSPVGGGLEGLAIGAGCGLGYALSTPRPGGGGMATPRGGARLRAALVTGGIAALFGIAISRAGGNLGGVSLDHIARLFQGSRVGLDPIAHLFGEEELGAITRRVLGAYECFFFGFGLVIGLTRRPGVSSRFDT